jgi:hypothetical protein
MRGVVVAVAAGLGLSGCIVQEIRDDLKSANARLGTVDQNLASTTEKLGVVERNLAETNTKLATANEQLTGVGGGLGTTNSSLGQLEQQLRLLESIDKSMVRLDGHLASLRGTIARIDSTIPFLDLGGDAPVETAAAPAGESGDASVKSDSAEAGVGEAGQRAGGPAGEEAAKASGGDAAGTSAAVAASTPRDAVPRDAWVGPWVSADPRRTFTLVLMADGQYMREESYKYGAAGAEVDATRVDLGTWNREGSGERLALVLTPRDGAKDAAGNIVPSRLRVLHQTSRTLTLSGGEGPRVLRKP